MPAAVPPASELQQTMVTSPDLPRDTDPLGAQIFGRYRLIERLGQGGMSDVFTAMAFGVEGFSRTFVLKRLRPELAHDREAIAQFVDEARLQASLVHSNIVPVFDFGRVGKEYFLTQEYIRGRDIVRLLSRYYDLHHRILDADVAYYIIYETLQALAYAHSKRDNEGRPLGIVHRDVSPTNVMVSLSGEVKLFDFGIVKANGRRSRTQVGMVKGNANFMSPEQARGHTVDARSDLYSLGLVLYYCLSNRLIYDGDNDLDVLYRAASGPTEVDKAAIAALPEPAASVLAQALAVDPADRFPDAAAFAAALEPHARGGKAATAKLMRHLFGEELQSEAA
jgi:serine/threonine protein kinase